MQSDLVNRVTNLADASVVELSALVAKKQCSAEEIVRSCLSRIDALDGDIQAFVDVRHDLALEQARHLDQLDVKKPLHGIPIAVKDTIDAAGFRCSWGTAIHEERIATRDAAAVTALKEAGAIVIGTTVSTEYAIAHSGPTRNPYDLTKTPGGSSSGSAAAVAARMVPLSLATQTLGSIVRPSIYCGVFGLKPTYGRISTDGMMPLSGPCDHLGPMARSLADIRLSFSIMTGGAWRDQPAKTGTRLKVLCIDGPFADRMETPTRDALNRARALFETQGHKTQAVTLPERFSKLKTCFENIVFYDMARNHGGDVDNHPDLATEHFHRVVDHGRRVSDIEYQAALSEAGYFREYLEGLLDADTIILAPATDGTAPMFSDLTGSQMLQSLWSVVGMPAIAVPTGFVDGLPIGVQLVASHLQESLVLQAADALVAGHDNHAMAD